MKIISTINSSCHKPATVILAAVAALSSLASCESDDTDFSSIINPTPDYELREIDFNYTPLQETESVPGDDNDYVENSEFSRIVTISFNGNSATVKTSASGISSTVDGAHVTINTTRKGVHYVLSGSSTNGSLKIYSERKFWLTLDGVDITNPNGAAINNQCGKSMYVELADGTTNTLTDGTVYNTPSNEDEKGTLFSEGQIIFNGKGTLSVNGNCRNGIASDDYIIFRPGSVINVNCTARNCVKANDGVSVRGGVLNLDTSGAGGKGINSESFVNIIGGRITAIATGATLIEGSDTTNAAAIKCDSSFVMTGGEVNLKCTSAGGKGLNANSNVTISGGDLTIETMGKKGYGSPKGLKSGGDVSFLGGSSYIYSAYSMPVDAGKEMAVGTSMTTIYSNDKRLVIIR